jgi:hypothetical protein
MPLLLRINRKISLKNLYRFTKHIRDACQKLQVFILVKKKPQYLKINRILFNMYM